jgi:hypothetical protein
MIQRGNNNGSRICQCCFSGYKETDFPDKTNKSTQLKTNKNGKRDL